MKEFHISDVLSVTTPRLMSHRHMEGVYDILGFLVGEEGGLYTHQLMRVNEEARPWLRTQFPQLMDDSPEMAELLKEFAEQIDNAPHDNDVLGKMCGEFVERVRTTFSLPEYLPVYEMGADMHTHIDPEEELRAIVGDDKVIAINLEPPEN
jgi:hypothetical protein